MGKSDNAARYIDSRNGKPLFSEEREDATGNRFVEYVGFQYPCLWFRLQPASKQLRVDHVAVIAPKPILSSVAPYSRDLVPVMLE